MKGGSRVPGVPARIEGARTNARRSERVRIEAV